MKSITGRLEGYRRRLIYEWSQWKEGRLAKERKKLFTDWLSQLERCPPDVLLGANFAAFGGVRGHIHAIQRYSTCNVQFAPPEELLRKLDTYSFTNTFRKDFLHVHAASIKVAHSHVYPWFIEWCQHHQQRGLRWIHTYHLNYYPEHGCSGEVEPWQQQINDAMLNQARFADVRLSVSKWQVEELLDQHGIEAEYLPNGVDVAFCDQACGDRFRDKHRLDRFVLYVGRDDPVKNPGEFVELAKRLPALTFVMIGGGLSRETLAAGDLSSLPQNLKILGSASPLDVQDALAACGALVVTSKREGLPTLVLEAMAHEAPLVVPDETGCMEAVCGGRFAEIYRLGDTADLEKALKTVLGNARRSTGAREFVLREFDWRVVSPLLDDVYRGMGKWAPGKSAR